MLGDLDGDHRWTSEDEKVFDRYASDPAGTSSDLAWRLDLNQNHLVDPEDRLLLRRLAAANSDPYTAEENARARGERFPRPREFYRYRFTDEFRGRPLWALPYSPSADSVFGWLAELRPPARLVTYEDELDAEIYNEAVRLDRAWRKRAAGLLPIESDYATLKFSQTARLHRAGDKFEFLLALIELVEDAETLSTRNLPEVAVKFLTLRDHLREVLGSALYADFKSGRQDWRAVVRAVSGHLQADLGVRYDFETLGPPRSLTNVENYLQRAEWQYYKSRTREEDFHTLIDFAQHDARYLRAVARTSRKLQDANVANHNLPMVLLFREALRIAQGDKKKAAGLVDEAIRIPFAWIKTIPREKLPASLAFDNFLLPGNKEDGGDKSRHWNVFGAICLYKNPMEALDLALKREMKDLREGQYAEAEMREFLRDMIGNLNGMFHVMAVNPALL
jgi:nitroreductase